ncbi:MAG: hypothetical protein DRR08_13870 [Candidatus Parabeggiatoa sp. nov. 2]|nr:MAG: hypothetical protein B6247_05005 [Beggiatoa sp. 4572_84]RKZ59467.1 MAG: hypothetical protein DRR08_13870 [Gammaproteobacteria bacterium]
MKTDGEILGYTGKVLKFKFKFKFPPLKGIWIVGMRHGKKAQFMCSVVPRFSKYRRFTYSKLFINTQKS